MVVLVQRLEDVRAAVVGAGSKPSLRSAPEEKPRPAPVISTARTDGSAASPSITDLISSPNWMVQALRLSGRLRVSRPRPSDTSQMTCFVAHEAPYATSMLLELVEWLGHSGFRIRVGRSYVYIDPYRVPADSPPADLILITHGHYDHFSPRDIELLSHRDTWMLAPAAVAERAGGRVLSLGPGDDLEHELVPGVDVARGGRLQHLEARRRGQASSTRARRAGSASR